MAKLKSLTIDGQKFDLPEGGEAPQKQWTSVLWSEPTLVVPQLDENKDIFIRWIDANDFEYSYNISYITSIPSTFFTTFTANIYNNIAGDFVYLFFTYNTLTKTFSNLENSSGDPEATMNVYISFR